MLIKKNRLFINQEPVTDDFILSLSAGRVIDNHEDSGFHVTESQKGALETFTIGQPVYDKDNNLMGYLSVGLYNRLNYHSEKKDFNGEKIPVEFWGIGKPTKYCEIGKQVFTYWQRWNKEDKQ